MVRDRNRILPTTVSQGRQRLGTVEAGRRPRLRGVAILDYGRPVEDDCRLVSYLRAALVAARVLVEKAPFLAGQRVYPLVPDLVQDAIDEIVNLGRGFESGLRPPGMTLSLRLLRRFLNASNHTPICHPFFRYTKPTTSPPRWAKCAIPSDAPLIDQNAE